MGLYCLHGLREQGIVALTLKECPMLVNGAPLRLKPQLHLQRHDHM